MECPNCHCIYDDTLTGCPICAEKMTKPDSKTAPGGSGPKNTGASDTEKKNRDSEYDALNGYEEKKGRSGFGRVILVTDMHMFGRKVAIKRFTNTELDQITGSEVLRPEIEERVLANAKTIAGLKHPNIIDVYFAGKYQDGVQIVMEYIDGGSIKETVEQKGRFDSEAAAQIGIKLCDGMALLHEQNIIHKNLGPENILLTKKGKPKIAGFSYEFEMGSQSVMFSETEKSAAQWMSPEQRISMTGVDCAGDIYSLGATLYFAATGEVPSEIVSDKLPESLREPLGTAMAENPENRFQSAREFGESLENVLISNRKTKIISEGTGEFPCYACAKPVPYKAAFCPACGIEILGIWKEKENLYRDTNKEIEACVHVGEFNEALRKMDAILPEFEHEHFVHLQNEVLMKKEWAQEEWNRVDEKKENLLSRLRKADAALDRKEADIAIEIAEDVKRTAEPYFKSVHAEADEKIKRAKLIKEDERTLKNELDMCQESAEKYLHHGDFERAKARITDVLKKIDRKAFPDMFNEAEEKLKYIDGLIRERMNESIALAEKAATGEDFSYAFGLLDTVIGGNDDAYESLRQKARDVKEKIQILKLDYERVHFSNLRKDFTKRIEEAGKKPMWSGPLLRPVVKSEIDELEDLKAAAKQVLKKRNAIWFGIFVVTVAVLAAILITAMTILQKESPRPESWVRKARLFTNVANVREGPDTSFGIIAVITNDEKGAPKEAIRLANDDEVEITALDFALSRQGHPWIKVLINKGEAHRNINGYISGKILEDMNGHMLFSEAVVDDACNVRKDPKSDSPVIFRLGKGNMVKILGKTGGEVWFKVFHETTGETGFVDFKQIRLVPSAVVIELCSLKDMPDEQGREIAKLEKDLRVYLLEKTVDHKGMAWYRVAHNSIEGYVSAASATVLGPDTEPKKK